MRSEIDLCEILFVTNIIPGQQLLFRSIRFSMLASQGVTVTVTVHTLGLQCCVEQAGVQVKGLPGMVHRSTPLIQTTYFESTFIEQAFLIAGEYWND